MTVLDRVIADSADRAAWMAARRDRIGASDAAHFAKMASIEKYVAAKLSPPAFHGSVWTESGNRWEPMLCAWAGIPHSTRMVTHPLEDGFVATPDGIRETSEGLVLAECKAKHGRIITSPSAAEWRQLAWQFYCIPEAISTVFIWGTIVDGELHGGEPQSRMIHRDHEKIVAATALIVPIARRVLAAIRAARDLEKELSNA